MPPLELSAVFLAKYFASLSQFVFFVNAVFT